MKCPLKSKRCQDGEGCYGESHKCDGFKDCSDGSDENNCPGTPRCIGNEFFKCGYSSKICLSKLCNGFRDCEDGSDEGPSCKQYDKIINISLKIEERGKVSFSWIHEKSPGQFDVSILNM
ncbi:Low-density lipoprotein receptor-related protein 4 [Thelohanellus kitauei]|uniref:Low-density lipoprotein receptor-related protein 4 n=1 Tax=Thelohanellus kitauei TaxID=669202 RepID=A0A0C2N9S4_THEKT|nr:Low-density lipoprotein receptor-related protein 4 [Thelohanellus kitauei]